MKKQDCEELLKYAESRVASFKDGVNEEVPGGKGVKLLCPGNFISG